MKATSRIVANEGGARSTKTYSICQKHIIKACLGEQFNMTISRARMTWLRDTAMKDFFDILDSNGLYRKKYHNKTLNSYQLYGSEFSFIGLDEEQKLRGRKQDYLWINEANEADKDSFTQGILRTSKQVTIDYNPSEMYSWIYDDVLTRKDCTLIHSTFLDNPFLDQNIANEIIALKDSDSALWSVFGQGKRAMIKSIIYDHWKLIDEMPADKPFCYGLDFGFNAPSALVQVSSTGEANYWNQLLYKRFLTTPLLIQELNMLIPNKSMPIYADSADPEKIQQIYQAGFNIHPADKAVKAGIDCVKSKPLYVTKNSVDLLHEIKFYKWMEDKNKNVLDEPVGVSDHAMDAGRYGTYSQPQPVTMATFNF